MIQRKIDGAPLKNVGQTIVIPIIRNSGVHSKTIKFTWRDERGPSFDQELSEYLTKEHENDYELLSMSPITTASETGYVDEVSVVVITAQC